MSFEAIRWALAQTLEKSSHKFVLVAMADCVNSDADDWVCWPSYRTLSTITGMDVRTVESSVRKLRSLGFIRDNGERKGETKRVVVYTLAAPLGDADSVSKVETNTPKNAGVCDEVNTPIFADNTPKNVGKHPQKCIVIPPKMGVGTSNGTSNGTRKKQIADLSDGQTPPDFDGSNFQVLNGKSLARLSKLWELPEQWGIDAESLGWEPAWVLKEAEKFRQYWTAGRGEGTRRSVKGWRQSWSNWLANAEKFRR